MGAYCDDLCFFLVFLVFFGGLASTLPSLWPSHFNVSGFSPGGRHEGTTLGTLTSGTRTWSAKWWPRTRRAATCRSILTTKTTRTGTSHPTIRPQTSRRATSGSTRSASTSDRDRDRDGAPTRLRRVAPRLGRHRARPALRIARRVRWRERERWLGWRGDVSGRRLGSLKIRFELGRRLSQENFHRG